MAQKGDHSHEPEYGKQDSRRVFEELKDLSRNKTPKVALATALVPTTDWFAAQLALPSKTSLLKTSQIIRKRNYVVQHPDPVQCAFGIPREFQHFVVFDSGKEDHERIFTFADSQLLKQLETAEFWLADGTFKVTPKVFYQLYTIHIQLADSAPACLYALLPSSSFTKEKVQRN